MGLVGALLYVVAVVLGVVVARVMMHTIEFVVAMYKVWRNP